MRKQKEVVQACIRKGANTAAQKAADNLQTILQEAGDALKTGQPQPAFAGVDNGTHLNSVPNQPRRSERLMKKVGEASKTSADSAKPGVLVGDVSELRKVKFFRGLQHGKENHFFGNKQRSLKLLDPEGNPEKWMPHFIRLAQQGMGPITNLPSGEMMEIMGTMPKTNDSGILSIGVRLFRNKGESSWKVATFLTKQPKNKE